MKRYTYFFLSHKKIVLEASKVINVLYDATTNEELKRLEIIISKIAVK